MEEPMESKLLQHFPPHIVLMAKAARRALAEGRARVVDGFLIIDAPDPKEQHFDLTPQREEM